MNTHTYIPDALAGKCLVFQLMLAKEEMPKREKPLLVMMLIVVCISCNLESPHG